MGERETIRVLLVDDHEMVRQGLAHALEDRDEIEVVAQAGDGPSGIQLATETNPDVIVLDYSMPGMDAPAVIEHLQRISSESKILVLTVHENIHYAVRVLEAGAHGYVIKSAAVQELMDAVRAVSEDEVYISPLVSQKVLQRLRGPRKRSGLDAPPPREFDLLRYLGSGMSPQDCAGRLHVSTSTASTYRSRLMKKLNLSSTAETIRFALENEIVG